MNYSLESLKSVGLLLDLIMHWLILCKVLDSEGKPTVTWVFLSCSPDNDSSLYKANAAYCTIHCWCYPKLLWRQWWPTILDEIGSKPLHNAGWLGQLLTSIAILALNGLFLTFMANPSSPHHAASHVPPAATAPAVPMPLLNLSVVAPQKENPTAAKKALLLDRHIGNDHLPTFYPSSTTTTMPASLVATNCTPCISPHHPQVSLPLYCPHMLGLQWAGQARPASKPCSTGCTSHAESGEQHIYTLSPRTFYSLGNAFGFIDQNIILSVHTASTYFPHKALNLHSNNIVELSSFSMSIHLCPSPTSFPQCHGYSAVLQVSLWTWWGCCTL